MEVCSRGSCVIGRDSTRSALVQRTPLREAEYKIAMTESMSRASGKRLPPLREDLEDGALIGEHAENTRAAYFSPVVG